MDSRPRTPERSGPTTPTGDIPSAKQKHFLHSQDNTSNTSIVDKDMSNVSNNLEMPNVSSHHNPEQSERPPSPEIHASSSKNTEPFYIHDNTAKLSVNEADDLEMKNITFHSSLQNPEQSHSSETDMPHMQNLGDHVRTDGSQPIDNSSINETIGWECSNDLLISWLREHMRRSDDSMEGDGNDVSLTDTIRRHERDERFIFVRDYFKGPLPDEDQDRAVKMLAQHVADLSRDGSAERVKKEIQERVLDQDNDYDHYKERIKNLVYADKQDQKISERDKKYFIKEHEFLEERYGHIMKRIEEKRKNKWDVRGFVYEWSHCFELQEIVGKLDKQFIDEQCHRWADTEAKILHDSMTQCLRDLKLDDQMQDPDVYATMLKHGVSAQKMVRAASLFIAKIEKRFLAESQKWFFHKLRRIRSQELERSYKEALAEFLLEKEINYKETFLPLLQATPQDASLPTPQDADSESSNAAQMKPKDVPLCVSKKALLKPVKDAEYTSLGIAKNEIKHENLANYEERVDKALDHYRRLAKRVFVLSAKDKKDRALYKDIERAFLGNGQVDRYYRRKAEELKKAVGNSVREDESISPELKKFFTEFHKKYVERYTFLKNKEEQKNRLSRWYDQKMKRHANRIELKEKMQDVKIYEQARAAFNQDIEDLVAFLEAEFPTKRKENRKAMCAIMIQSLAQAEQKYLLSVVKARVELRRGHMDEDMINMISGALHTTSLAMWVSAGATVGSRLIPQR